MKGTKILSAPRNIITLIALTLIASGCVLPSQRPLEHPLAKPAVDRLLSDDELLKKEALVELTNLGEGVMPELSNRFEDAPAKTKIKIVELAVSIAEPGALVSEVFAQAAKDETLTVRYAAATLAAKLPQHAPLLSDIMRTLLDDTSADIRAAALTTLASFPGPPQPEPAELLRLLKDRHAMVTATAANIAVKRHEPYVQAAARAALPRLIGALHDKQPSTRASCLFAIGQFGLVASPAIAPISHVLATDPVPEVRLQAALSLLRIGTPAARTTAREALTRFAKDSNPLIRNAAKAAL